MEEVHSKPHAIKCGAKTRSGKPCNNYAMGNGRCRMHGGKSTGPKDKVKKSKDMKNNKNGVTTHERESIVFDYLEDDEKELLKLIDLDKLKQIDNEIKLVDIRLRRMMKRIQILNEKEYVVDNYKIGMERDGETNITESVDSISKIQNIEDAITRVQGTKLRLIEAKHKLELDLDIVDETRKAQLEQIKVKTEKIKGISSDIEDITALKDAVDWNE